MFKTSSWWIKAALAMAACIYALIFAEGFLRIFAPQPMIPRYVTGTDLGIRGNIPNASYWQFTPEVKVNIKINGQGLRADRDFSQIRARNTCRIAMLGDSFTIGYEASLTESIAGQLEAMLLASGFRVELLNFGVSGFGTAEMIVQFNGFARKFSPDITVFQFHDTDFDDNVRSALYRFNDNGEFERAAETYLPAIGIRDRLQPIWLYRMLEQHSHLYSAARERIATWTKSAIVAVRSSHMAATGLTAPADADDEHSDGVSDRPKDYAEELTRALLFRARDRVEAAGSAFVILNIPARRTRISFRSSLERVEPLGDVTPMVVDITGPFHDAARPDLRLFLERGHGHFTEEGNRLAAEVLSTHLMRRHANILDNCRIN